jgi:hypothetical protein
MCLLCGATFIGPLWWAFQIMWFVSLYRATRIRGMLPVLAEAWAHNTNKAVACKWWRCNYLKKASVNLTIGLMNSCSGSGCRVPNIHSLGSGWNYDEFYTASTLPSGEEVEVIIWRGAELVPRASLDRVSEVTNICPCRYSNVCRASILRPLQLSLCREK